VVGAAHGGTLLAESETGKGRKLAGSWQWQFSVLF